MSHKIGWKNALSLAICLCVICAALTWSEAAWAGDTPISYLDTDGTIKSEFPDEITAGGTLEGGGINGGWYFASGERSVGELVISGDVKIILTDGCKLIARNIVVSKGSSLSVYGQSENPDKMGQLNSNVGESVITDPDTGAVVSVTYGNGTFSGPGIGAPGGEVGAITFNGGKVVAGTMNSHAAIGTSTNAADPNLKNSAVITINGGVVIAVATRNGNGAAIGGGGGKIGTDGGVITINGGTVDARGANNGGAAIGGGGLLGDGGTITITGGTVIAQGGGGGASYSAGIGGSANGTNLTECGNAGDITITGGTITAIGGGANNPGIGAGRRATGGNITIAGGTVHSYPGKTGGTSPGIGAGAFSNERGILDSIVILPGATIDTKRPEDSAVTGIGNAKNVFYANSYGDTAGRANSGGFVTAPLTVRAEDGRAGLSIFAELSGWEGSMPDGMDKWVVPMGITDNTGCLTGLRYRSTAQIVVSTDGTSDTGGAYEPALLEAVTDIGAVEAVLKRTGSGDDQIDVVISNRQVVITSPVDRTVTVILAGYRGDELADIVTKDFELLAQIPRTVELSQLSTEHADRVKVMVWQDKLTMVHPLIKAIPVIMEGDV